MLRRRIQSAFPSKQASANCDMCTSQSFANRDTLAEVKNAKTMSCRIRENCMNLVCLPRRLIILGFGFAGAAILSACGISSTVESNGVTTSSTTQSDATNASTLPTVTLSAAASSVESGQTVILHWQSTNAQACMASGGWSGTQPTSGGFTTHALTSATTFSLSCSGTGGSTSKSVTVAVTSASDATTPPMVSHRERAQFSRGAPVEQPVAPPPVAGLVRLQQRALKPPTRSARPRNLN
jgi:hypothetical protein